MRYLICLFAVSAEVGIYKRKQENTLSTKKATKKKKKKLSFFSWSLSWSSSWFLVFFISSFLIFFYKFPPQRSWLVYLCTLKFVYSCTLGYEHYLPRFFNIKKATGAAWQIIVMKNQFRIFKHKTFDSSILLQLIKSYSSCFFLLFMPLSNLNWIYGRKIKFHILINFSKVGGQYKTGVVWPTPASGLVAASLI